MDNKILKNLIIPNEVIEDKFSKYEPPIHYTGPGLREQLAEGNVTVFQSAELYKELYYKYITGIDPVLMNIPNADPAITNNANTILTPTGTTTTPFYGYSTSSSNPIETWKMAILDFGTGEKEPKSSLEQALINRFKILS